ncbi:hypothetical protein [Mucilaginibacter sp. HD30]
MLNKTIGSNYNNNDKQPVILATLRDIHKAKINMVQLTLIWFSGCNFNGNAL